MKKKKKMNRTEKKFTDIHMNILVKDKNDNYYVLNNDNKYIIPKIRVKRNDNTESIISKINTIFKLDITDLNFFRLTTVTKMHGIDLWCNPICTNISEDYIKINNDNFIDIINKNNCPYFYIFEHILRGNSIHTIFDSL